MDTNKWPDELDALQASADHHKLLFENDKVRVLEVRIPAGVETSVHTHKWPATVYSLSWSNFIRFDTEGNILLQSGDRDSAPAPVVWSEPIPPHTLRNVGKNEIRNICVEIKTPAE